MRAASGVAAWLGCLALAAVANAQGPPPPTPDQPHVESLFDPPPPAAWADSSQQSSPGVTFTAPTLPCDEGCPPDHAGLPPQGPWQTGPSGRPWLLSQFDLRHSTSHGRAMGPGDPLRGTSWLNRPYTLSLDGGALLMTGKPAPNVRKNNDLFGAVGLGWDWDHYWGSQFRVGWSTPDLLNTQQPTASPDDNLFITDLSLLYYPWGDARTRPYYRLGIGLTDVEYTNDFGVRINDMLLTIPVGIGVKYQVRRWMAWRLELANNIAFGQGETDSLQNLTLTGGLEWRFGGRPANYWAWAPRGGAW